MIAIMRLYFIVVFVFFIALTNILYCEEVDDLIGELDLDRQAEEEKIDKEDLKKITNTVFFEGETFNGISSLSVYDTWIVGGLSGSRDYGAYFYGKKPGIALTRKINIPADGKYNVWARYQMGIGYNACFRFEIIQDGKTVFSKKYYDYLLEKGDVAANLEKEKGWYFDDPALRDGGIVSKSVTLWESGTAELKKGEAEARIITEKMQNPIGTPFIDCFILTQSLTYKPHFKDATSVCVRFKLLEVEPEDVECSLDLSFLRRDGLRSDLGFWYYNGMSGIMNPDGEVFGKDEYTAWVGMNKYLNKGGSMCSAATIFKSDREIKKAKLEIQVAWGPDEKKIFKTFVEKGDGSTFAFDMPCELVSEARYYQMFKSVSEQVDSHYAVVKDMNIDTSVRLKYLTITTGGVGGWKSYFCDPELLMKEFTVLQAMGINGTEGGYSYDKKYLDKTGMKTTYFAGSAGNPVYDLWDEEKHCPNGPEIEGVIDEKYSKSTDYYKSRNIFKEYGLPYKFLLGDEIGCVVSSKHIENCTNCIRTFRTFLKDYCKLKPEEFGRKSFDEVKFIGEKEDAEGRFARKLHYYSRRFLSYNTIQFYAKVTRAVEKYYGPVPTYANYSPAILGGDGVGELDWIELGRLRGTTLGWSEDWGYKPVSFLVDFFKAPGRYYGEPVGMYLVGHSGDHQRKLLSCLAHGARYIWIYDYGPYFCSTGDAFSENSQAIRNMAEAAPIIGRADDLLYYGKMKRPEIAFLYSRSGEIWKYDGAHNMEMKRIYLSLLYNQITVDIINEDDVLNDQLKQYKVLFMFYANVREDASNKISDWVKQGGNAVGFAGCGIKDEVDNKTNTLTDMFGIKHIKTDKSYFLKYLGYYSDTRDYKGKITITDNKVLAPVEIECLQHKSWIEPTTARTLGVFEDGSPAVCYNEYGKGRTIYFAVLPGASFWKNIHAYWIPKLDENREKQFSLMPAMLKNLGVGRDVTVSKFGIEAVYVGCETGVAVPLINYTDTQQENVTVRINYPGNFKTVESSVYGKLEYKRTGGNEVEVVIPYVKLIDVVMIRKF